MKGKQILYVILILSLLLSGCGVKRTATGETGNAPGDNVLADGNSNGQGEVTSGEALGDYYYIEEMSLPNPDLTIQAVVPEGGRFYGMAPILQEDTVYRWVYLYDGEGKPVPSYLQYLNLTEGEWENINASEDFEINGKQYSGFNAPFLMNNGEVYSRVYIIGEEDTYLGRLEKGAVSGIIQSVPTELTTDMQSCIGTPVLTCDKDGVYYYFCKDKSNLSVLDGMLQKRKETELPGSILNIIQAEKGTDSYWYGTDEEGNAVIMSVSGEKCLLKDFNKIGMEYWAEYADDGTLYLADSQNIWCVNGEAELVYPFMQNDYIINDIYSMNSGKNGEIRLLVDLDKEYSLLTLKRSTEPLKTEKQEIILAFAMQHLALNKEIARFNRQNDKYHISVMLPEEGEDWSTFCEHVKMEISVGRGPDILGHDVIMNIAPYVENGYLECLDGMLEDESVYLQAALDGCRVDGKLYGIPYDCTIHLVSYPAEYTGGCAAWTLPEMMKAIRSSDAKILQKGCDGVDIVLQYALYDNSNTAYIDWIKGKSHLTEKPFLDLLDFAKNYADTGKFQEEEGELIKSGEVFAVETYMDDLNWMNALNACFQGNPAIIGYPRAEGNGFYVSCRELYINNNSAAKEGAKEFLKYLLSDNVQGRYIQFNIYDEITRPNTILMGHRAQFPIHMGAFEALLNKETVEKEFKDFCVSYGVRYDIVPLTDEQKEQFRYLLEHAEPAVYNASAIAPIVSEELAPYFAGDVTAEAAAEKLHNRVQLYLDERAK